MYPNCAVSHLHRDDTKTYNWGSRLLSSTDVVQSKRVNNGYCILSLSCTVHSSEKDVTVISESEAWWKYGHLLDVVYIVVVVVVIFVIRVRVYYSLPRNGFIKTGNYYGIYIIYLCIIICM